MGGAFSEGCYDASGLGLDSGGLVVECGEPCADLGQGVAYNCSAGTEWSLVDLELVSSPEGGGDAVVFEEVGDWPASASEAGSRG